MLFINCEFMSINNDKDNGMKYNLRNYKKQKKDESDDSDDESQNQQSSKNKKRKFDKFIEELESKYCSEISEEESDNTNEEESDNTNEEDELYRDDQEKLDEINESEDEEIDEEEFKTIKEQLCKDKPSLSKILNSESSFENKCKMVELYDIYTYCPPSYEKIALKETINMIMKDKTTTQTSKEEKKIEELLSVDTNLKYKILNSKMNEKHKALVYNKYLRYINSSDNEKGKIKEWIDYSLQIPQEIKPIFEDINSHGKIRDFLLNVKLNIDKKLYGMSKVKNEILMILNHMIINPSSTGHAMAIIGKPGTGKTKIIRALADAINLPFEQISLGGANDASFLDGHSYTYEGATPGIIVKTMCKLGYKNGIIFFDEFDKLAQTEHGIETSSNLLHITDFTQNNEFRDKYLSDITMDLSHVWFIYSLNDEKMIDSVLRDRIPLLYVDGYNLSDKIKISQNYTIPEILKNMNLNCEDVVFTKDILEYIIHKGNLREDGVRKLNEVLIKIIRKLLFLKSISCDANTTTSFDVPFMIDNFKLPITLTKKDIDKLIDIAEEESISKRMMYL